MGLLNWISMSGGESAPAVAESVDLDGTNDYLSRSSDFVGNVDSKAFTFSCWVYKAPDNAYYLIDSQSGGSSRRGLRFQHEIDGSGRLSGYNSSGVIVLDVSFQVGTFIDSTSFNILVSIDLNSSVTRSVYVNDIEILPTWSTYTNTVIDFKFNTLVLGGNYLATPSTLVKGRLSHLFLDYTHWDLSIEANRRLFITEDGKPAQNLESLNPIAYFKMDDPTTWHINSGTGGNMVPNGVIGRSGRGPNQWNCAMSDLTTADWLRRGVLTGAIDSKQFTFSTNLKIGSGTHYAYYAKLSSVLKIRIELRDTSNSSILINDAAGNGIVTADFPAFISGTNKQLSISFDSADAGKRHMFVDDVDVTSSVTWTLYSTDGIIPWSGINDHLINDTGGGVHKDVSFGEWYLDNIYTDLTAGNPFWDSDQNRPKPVLQVIEETGHTPLIAMPIRADDPTRDYGTGGGGWALNGGPLVGARGGSEYWSRSAVVDGTNYLTGNVYCESLVKWKSLDGGTTWAPTYLNAVTVTDIGNGTDNGIVSYYWGTSENINWALEESLLRVTDGLGSPVDMNQVIKDNPNSVLALDFSDPDNLGNNKAGVNFTVNGTVTKGADVNA